MGVVLMPLSDNGTGQLKHSTINFTLPYCSPNSVIASFVPLSKFNVIADDPKITQ